MANPKKLIPGMMVRRKDDPSAPVFKFISRYGSKMSRCQCDEYKGLDGPNDPGYVDVPDWNMSRGYELVYTRS